MLSGLEKTSSLEKSCGIERSTSLDRDDSRTKDRIGVDGGNGSGILGYLLVFWVDKQ
ncbi:hypothetical protein KFK09_007252 [Dendrobium nobile]|uniref:Uncharacterized protein n=1 Tax=Dendrobium nobile TaxID=94219 RepID=A0A8T3BVX9_DENNO|nr:hypothetical protein KFK09_007252 [Dendrobium nobile]